MGVVIVRDGRGLRALRAALDAAPTTPAAVLVLRAPGPRCACSRPVDAARVLAASGCALCHGTGVAR